ncbi:MAG: sugar phosphate isomerase/epimerase [Planctomycetota bacterium]
MNKRIGAATDDFAVPVKIGLNRVAHLGFGSVELGISSAELDPRALTRSGRRHLARYVRDLGLSLSALAADPAHAKPLGAANLEARIDHARAVLEMAAEVGVPVVTVRLGRLIDPSTHQRTDQAGEVLQVLGEHADRVGAVLAIRAGDDGPDDLAALFDCLSCPALRVCLDPAALLSVGREVSRAVESLGKYVALSHTRDATLTGSPERLVETNLGRGEVDLTRYLVALAAAGYAGPHIVRRTDALDPMSDLAESKAYLEALLRRVTP